jgi:hypothetical protein
MSNINDVRDDEVVAYLRIAVRRNGAMSVEGCINEETYAKSMLDAARDVITRHNRKKINDAGIILPASREFIG